MMKLKRNYKFLQFALDLGSLYQLYLIASFIIDVYVRAAVINDYAVATDDKLVFPEMFVLYGVVAGVVFLYMTLMPLMFLHRYNTNLVAPKIPKIYRGDQPLFPRKKWTQLQFDIWVYGVYMTRTLLLMTIFYLLDFRYQKMFEQSESLVSTQVLLNILLIIVIVRFTGARIKAAEPKKEGSTRIIMED